MDKLKIIKSTRKIAADTLLQTLKEVLRTKNPTSEVGFRDNWLENLRKHQKIFPNGWYEPPPHGIVVLFSNDEYPTRISYDTLRPQSNWPKEDSFLDLQNGIAYLFASPTDKSSGIIGDFGITIYFGQDNDIKDHLKNCLSLDKEIFEQVSVGQSFAQVWEFTGKLLKQKGLKNEIISFTDPAGVNLGHTIPSTDRDWTNQENKVIKIGESNWQRFIDMISQNRIFVSSKENFKIKPRIAFTIEPRPSIDNKPNIPTALSFHTIALFYDDNKKELITGFDEIFKLAGMDYMLS